ncbi:unnamed protein product [Pleuronectes platessa]|uniref:Uncharacterized protein n=1 Tax=Pleuronectes platessa TaxID=8262 RepID=A0A9N7YE22_PLEPL|nr:unnamed protein product [Pleuronectes platessa]
MQDGRAQTHDHGQTCTTEQHREKPGQAFNVLKERWSGRRLLDALRGVSEGPPNYHHYFDVEKEWGRLHVCHPDERLPENRVLRDIRLLNAGNQLAHAEGLPHPTERLVNLRSDYNFA